MRELFLTVMFNVVVFFKWQKSSELRETLFFVSFKMSLLFAKNVQSIFFYKKVKKAYLKKKKT